MNRGPTFQPEDPNLREIIKRAREGPGEHTFDVGSLLGSSYGALVVYGRYSIVGTITTVYALNEKGQKDRPYYASLEEYIGANGKTVMAAVFPVLSPGDYIVNRPGFASYDGRKITIFPGHVAETTY